jgi:hypothetical protein
MSDDKKLSLPEAQQHFAVECNNKTWDLIEKPGRTPEEDVEMIHQVHTSCWHWSKVGEPVNMARGHYLAAKVYFAAGMAESACFWARKTWDQTVELGLESWDYAFGCEIMARAHAAAGEKDKHEELYRKAQDAIAGLDKGERELCQGELDRGPWFGMK